jgi:hypothetical protein
MFISLFEQQGGKCKICDIELSVENQNLTKGTKRKGNDCVVDHCHKTNKVRGLLCFHCNTALGHVFDNPLVLNRMINYLKT